ncbi:glucans biosynthesis glucosyltransferase MdoH [Pelagicoccus sp. SDUM812002]|uniref:glucans biosynthesis glucosyltransferase MdoH n=1 Tax=Pelagicoccus sp. SDUM812002 TaxID=3041266 RepID=UPI00280E7D54|nr:glucans biosynthesis glucosyltransferase MdoH [Pelagicoccus sp. SDUM812002]MDQ8186036.1 glucans biosynthesis glucosyltransferase MdoH [Pelagicoccus sp. SDUM812002]
MKGEIINFGKFFDWQRLFFFVTALLFTIFPTVLFGNLLWRVGIEQGLWPVSFLFAILTWNISWGATHSLVGFFKRRREARRPAETCLDPDNPGSVAVVLPVYNEDPRRVFAGLKTMYESLQKQKGAEFFDFYILSDSTKPERWLEEEQSWAALCRDLKAFGRIYYRRRSVNTDKKAGNLLEFCESWGARYRYMVTLDADSIMSGETLTALYRRMEADTRIGILQTAPKIVYSESFWGRLQQFSNHFYGPVFIAGLNFWQGGQGNYWGHNAIIRMAPFIEHCALPDLPGREPFGGKILSHDFVEAALMQRAGFEVRLADDLEGSYEECPQDMVEHAKRDRRWCQGNMQHFWLLFSRGLTFASRLHLGNGIMGYASSLLWALFLVLSGILMYNRVRSNLSLLPTSGFGDLFRIPLSDHGLLVAGVTFSLLFLPKVLALLDAFLSEGRTRVFGGGIRCTLSVLLEIVSSALVAPIMMLYHGQFVVFTALGKGVGWSTQNRLAGDGLSLYDAFVSHRGHAIVGIAFTLLARQVSESFLYWTLPVSGAMVLAPIVSWISSKPSIGRWLRRMGILETPVEHEVSEELVAVHAYEEDWKRKNWIFEETDSVAGLMNAAVDPYLNSIRVTLARESESTLDAANAERLGESLLFKGVEGLRASECKLVLGDADLMSWLHRQVWTLDPEDLHESWEPLFNRYSWMQLQRVG